MDIVIIKSIFAFIISFLITFYLVPILYNIALSYNVVDAPDGKVKCHAVTTPYLGGVAVYAGFIVALALAMPFDNQFTLFFIGLTLLVLAGLIDDLVVMKPHQKFFCQSIATLCFLKAGLYLKEQFFTSSVIAIPCSCLWMLSVINAFNLVDVMDGLSSSIAICATLGFISLAWATGQTTTIILLSAFLGPVCAFLWYNKPQAKMYLGDAGSLFLGGFMAVVPFLFNWTTYTSVGFLAPVIILSIPLFELVGLIIIRTYKKIPFYKASPDHFSIYLRKRSWTVWQILIFVISISCALSAIAIPFSINRLSLPYTIGLLFLLAFLWIATVFKEKLFKNAPFA